MQARIYRPAKTAMQSGKGNIKKWVLEFFPTNSRSADPLMGWTSNKDTKSQIKLKFESKEQAEEYAAAHGIKYIVIVPKVMKLRTRAYADNFM